MTGGGASLAALVEYLDGYLRIREVPDEPPALNGLQVENRGRVWRIVAAVDATEATIQGLGEPGGAALLLVHHGLFWDGNQPLTGRRYRRIRGLLDRDAALYSAHIPLDVHAEVGNNAVLARRLGLTATAEFGSYRGIPLGVAGDAPPALRPRAALGAALARELGLPAEAVRLVAGGDPEVNRVGVITGGAGGMIAQAREAGCDAFITGEGSAHHFHDAMELGLNVYFAGHYATETVGVKALAAHLAEKFSLPWEFHDHPTGM
jgi:dinuclear metal center YbgI/SA1388 family protein